MKCEEVEIKMIDYLDKTLSESERHEIEKHLETCERCLDELRDTQHVLNLISDSEMIKPDDSLRINFYHMLHSEIKKSSESSNQPLHKTHAPWYSIRYRIAAGFALLIVVHSLGMLINGGLFNSYNSNEVKQLHSEVSDLRKTAMFTMLKDVSSSDRIQAVSYADELDKSRSKCNYSPGQNSE